MATNKIFIEKPCDVAELLKKWAKKREENFLAITLDGQHNVIRVHHITKGIANKTIVHPRECFFPVIKDNAIAVIFAHNHPSCSVEPSEEDDDIYKKLEMASEILGFHMVDGMIITRDGQYYSYRRNGKLGEKYSYEEFDDYVATISSKNRRGE